MYETICYQRNYISEIICRLDFASQISDFRKSMPREIYSIIKRHFPIAEPQDVIGTELSINPISGPQISQITTKQWVSLSRDRKNKCTIEPNSVIFSLTAYSVFEETRAAILDILNVIMEKYPENQGKRLGLRFINSIPLAGHDDWINCSNSEERQKTPYRSMDRYGVLRLGWTNHSAALKL